MQKTELEKIRVTINGTVYHLSIKPWSTLLDILRDDLGLTGTKEGCAVGECGACTVLLDDNAVNACLVLALEAQDRHVTTIEGLASGDNLHPIQQAFLETGGMQCGFCTPGTILSAKALLDKNSNPTEQEIRKALEGNFCRCAAYTKTIASVKEAAHRMKEK